MWAGKRFNVKLHLYSSFKRRLSYPPLHHESTYSFIPANRARERRLRTFFISNSNIFNPSQDFLCAVESRKLVELDAEIPYANQRSICTALFDLGLAYIIDLMAAWWICNICRVWTSAATKPQELPVIPVPLPDFSGVDSKYTRMFKEVVCMNQTKALVILRN